jgi:hypothetical protein
VFALSEQCKQHAKKISESVGTSAFERIFPAFQSFDCLGVQNYFSFSRFKDIVQETGVVIVGMRQKDEFDFAWLNIEFLKFTLETGKAVLVAGVNENIAFIGLDKVVVDDSVAEIVNRLHNKNYKLFFLQFRHLSFPA